MSNETYVVPNWDGFSHIWKIVAIVLLILVLLLWLLGYGPGGRNCGTNVVAADADAEQCGITDNKGAVIAAGAGAAGVAAADDDFLNYEVPAYGFVDNSEAQRLYFGLGSHALPEDSDGTLQSVIDALNENPETVAVVSGFHDPSGDLASNQRLAKNRAESVHAKLLAMGVAADRLVLEKPFSTTGTGTDQEARRVEVRLATLE
ncbi:MAG: OmpA family protein [Pseudomonadales bacterium]